MKALSIRQPWAGAILAGLKTIETRTWATAYRGPLLIHAGKKPMDRETALATAHWAQGTPDVWGHGLILGRVELLDCRPMVPADEVAAGCEFYPGAVAWVLANPVILPEPWEYKGELGLFEVDCPHPRGEQESLGSEYPAHLAGTDLPGRKDVLRLRCKRCGEVRTFDGGD